MVASGGRSARRPGDNDDFDRRPDPNAQFLGEQSVVGGGGLLMALNRLVRSVLRRRR